MRIGIGDDEAVGVGEAVQSGVLLELAAGGAQPVQREHQRASGRRRLEVQRHLLPINDEGLVHGRLRSATDRRQGDHHGKQGEAGPDSPNAHR